MPLRIDLKPFERMIVNGAAIRNGSKRSTFIVETRSKILREGDIIREDEANTPCKKVYLALVQMYLSDKPMEAETSFMLQATEIMRAAPSMRPFFLAIFEDTQAGDYYKALKCGRKLIEYEERLMEGLLGALSCDQSRSN